MNMNFPLFPFPQAYTLQPSPMSINPMEYFKQKSVIEALYKENCLLKEQLQAKDQEISQLKATASLEALPRDFKLKHEDNSPNYTPLKKVTLSLQNEDVSSEGTADQSEDNIDNPSSKTQLSPPIVIKIENNPKLEEIEDSSDDDEDDEDEEARAPKIRRRNGFKGDANNTLKMDDAANANRKRSKAKHLWISYGRKIVEYAVKHSKPNLKKKIQKFDNKLKSKKAYTQTFRIIKNKQTEEEVAFRREFGRLALKFLQTEVEDAFLNSNYRDDFLNQKEKVSNWIARQIKEN